MHRISPNNPVRRRLFFDDHDDSDARVDNLTNVLQESIANDNAEKMKKWNYDFKNDIPLEGDYEWYRADGNIDWIGVKRDTEIESKIESPKEQDSFLPMKNENEITPKSCKDDETAPLIRKRKNDLTTPIDKGVRRKISFD